MRFVLCLFALVSFAAPTLEPDCETRTIVVCKSKRKKVPRPTAVTPLPVVVQPPHACPTCTPKTVVLQEPVFVHTHHKPTYTLGALAEVGFSTEDPTVSGLFGLRVVPVRHPVGFQLFGTIPAGTGVQVLPYLYRGKHVNWHAVDPGLLYTSARGLDAVFGTGVEYKLGRRVSLLADLRFALPLSNSGTKIASTQSALYNPGSDHDCDGDNGGDQKGRRNCFPPIEYPTDPEPEPEKPPVEPTPAVATDPAPGSSFRPAPPAPLPATVSGGGLGAAFQGWFGVMVSL